MAGKQGHMIRFLQPSAIFYCKVFSSGVGFSPDLPDCKNFIKEADYRMMTSSQSIEDNVERY